LDLKVKMLKMIKLNNKYKPLIGGVQRYNIISGGRASGKSFSIASYLLALTLEKGNVILFSRWTMSSIKISVYPEFLEKIEMLNIGHLYEITKNEIINIQTGSKIIFKGIKTGSNLQTANLKSIANLNIVVIDEAEEIPDEETFDKIDLSARRNDKDNKIILIFNPTTKVHWIYERFFESVGIQPGICKSTDDTNYIHSTYLDNKKYLSESIIKQIEKIKVTNRDKYEHIMLGAFLDVAEGVIFKNWEIGEFNNELEYGFGEDFGFSPDPDTLVKVAVDTKNKIIYLDECIYQTGLITSELIDKVKSYSGDKKIIADNSSNRLITELSRAGINISPCVKGAGSIEEGIKLILDYRIVVTSKSVNIIKELNNYIWSDKRAGQPKDIYNHAIDAIRYYVTHIIKTPPSDKIGVYKFNF
jgi:phage terminase large subunit